MHFKSSNGNSKISVTLKKLLTTSTGGILRVGISEIQNAKRSVRFWILISGLLVLVFLGYLFSTMYLKFGALYSPSFGIATTRYLLGNISPFMVLMFQLGTLVLLFDSSYRIDRERIGEVLNSKPVASFEYLLGRVLGISALLWFVTLLFVINLHGVGLVCQFSGIDFAEPFEICSIVNLLLLDAPVSFLSWCSVVVFLTSVIRSRVSVLILGFALMTTWTYVVIESSYALVAITSASANDSLFVSDLLPEFASAATIGTRLATLLFAAALITFAASFVGRIDCISSTLKNWFGAVVMASSGVLFGLVVWSILHHYYEEPAQWNKVYESQTLDGTIDVLEISGSVRINPKKLLHVDLELLFKTDTNEKLAFIFNPAMKILKLELDGYPTPFKFRYGLLELDMTNIDDSIEVHRFHIIAQGIPEPRFGYFSSAINYFTDSSLPIQAVALFGKDGSIYDNRYVALMSGVHWYPTANFLEKGSWRVRERRDFFAVDLNIELFAKNWTLVGPETSFKSTSDNSNMFHVNPKNQLTEINLFASEFESEVMEMDGIQYALYLHKKHASNLRIWTSDLFRALQERVGLEQFKFTSRGLSLPETTINFIEVPNRLRTVGGGWRMKALTTLPEIALLRESGFPVANIDSAFQHQIPRESFPSEEVWHNVHFDLLAEYFELGLGTDNPFSGFMERLWLHSTHAAGDYAEVLDEVVLSLISPSTVPFSIYSTLHVAELTQLTPPDQFPHHSFNFVRRAKLQEHIFGSRLEVWDYMEQTSLNEPTTSKFHQKDIELVLLKAREIARGLQAVNEEEQIALWLMKVRDEFAGRSYSLNDLVNLAKRFDIQVEPFLTGWLKGWTVPGYSLSSLEISRVENDKSGIAQYQTSVTIHNSQPVEGVIQLIYPTEQWANKHMWEDWRQISGVRIAAKSSKRINITTPYELRRVQFVPYLSLDRSPFVLHVKSDVEVEWQDVAPRPLVEDVDWDPVQEDVIIVDDLDTGFSMKQSHAKQVHYISVGPSRWFSLDRLWTFEVDQGLPVYRGAIFRLPREMWHRRPESGSFGRHRKTTAVVWNPRSKLPHTVSFTADIPTPGTWTLDYHLPIEWELDFFSKVAYKLKVQNENQVWYTEFDTGSDEISKGWNLVTQCDLDVGVVIVEVIGSSSPGLLFADAIQWTLVEEEE